MLCFSIADGALPSNDEEVMLRRILRRASRFGRSLGLIDPFLHDLVSVVIEIMGENYPELGEKESHIKKVIYSEETSFNDTLDRGLTHFERIRIALTPTKLVVKMHLLHDTFGFPLDLTQLMAREKLKC